MHLERLISVLEAVAIAGRPITAVELQAGTGLPRPTCYRLLQTLSKQGLLDQSAPEGGYKIGRRLTRIALLGQSDDDVVRIAKPTLMQAANDFGEAVFISRFRNKGVEIIYVATPQDGSRSYVHPGMGFRPMHACSCSKAIAAFADEDFQAAILEGSMKSYTERTMLTAQELKQEFEDIQKRGFAECVEEIEMGVSSVAAPIHIGNIGAPFSIGATGPIRRFTQDRREEIGLKLSALADKVAASLQLYSLE